MCGLWIIVWKRSPIKDPLGIIRMSDFKSQKKPPPPPKHPTSCPKQLFHTRSPLTAGHKSGTHPPGPLPKVIFQQAFWQRGQGCSLLEEEFWIAEESGYWVTYSEGGLHKTRISYGHELGEGWKHLAGWATSLLTLPKEFYKLLL